MKTSILPLAALLMLTTTLPAAIRTWTGAGANGNWSTAANWDGNRVPLAGDELVFPALESRMLTLRNDLSSAFYANSIAVQGSGYVVSGDTTLNGDFVNASPRSATFWNGSLRLRRSLVIRNSGVGSLVIGGGINLNGSDVTLRNTGPPDTEFTITSVISGTGNVTLDGSAGVTFGGGSRNTYTGVLSVNSGVLSLDKDGGGAVSGDLVAGDGFGSDVVKLLRNAQLPAAGTVRLKRGGRLEFAAANLAETIGQLSLEGGVCAGRTDSLLSIDGDLSAVSGSSRVEGKVQFLGGPRHWVTARDASVVMLGDVNTSGVSWPLLCDGGGVTTFQAGLPAKVSLLLGTWHLNGANPNTDIVLEVATLSGTGSVREINNQHEFGRIAPGPGIARFSCQTLSLRGGLRMKVETYPVTCDNLAVSGRTTLVTGRAELEVVLPEGTVPRVGDVFTLLTNAATAPLTGEFAGLPEGASFTAGNVVFGITYHYGSSRNSIAVFVKQILPTGSNRMWTALPTAAPVWSNIGAWDAGVLPQQGDTLNFPAGDLHKSPVNTALAGSTFAGLNAAGGYDFLGNAWITGAGGLTVTGGPDPVYFTFNGLSLSTDAAFTIAAGGRMVVDMPVDTKGHTLTLNVNSSTRKALEFDDAITGGGRIIKTGEGLAMTDGPVSVLQMTVAEGKLQLLDDTGTTPVVVNSGATFAMDGSAGNLRALGGTVRPGSIFSLFHTPGTMSVGNCTLESSATLVLHMQGTTPGTGYSRIVATGPVQINGATLDPFFLSPFFPAAGFVCTIIDNDGTDSVIGSFRGLREGTIFAVRSALESPSLTFRISYRGGDGNDVILTRVPAPAVTYEHSSGESFKWSYDESGENRRAVVMGRGLPGVGYHLEAAFNVSAGPWMRLTPENGIIAGANGDINFYDNYAWQFSRRFYRIVSPE